MQTLQFSGDSAHTDKLVKIAELLARIDASGLKKLSSRKDPKGQEFMHVVFYQAIDDHLRIVYDQLMSRLDEVNLRDSDALHFIRRRDF